MLGRDFANRVLKMENIRLVIKGLGILLLILLGLECGLNIWVRVGLRRSLAADTGGKTEIVSKVSWLGLKDILAGKVNRVQINARNCLLNDLRYSRLVMDSEGFRFDLGVLLKEKRFKIREMERTRINGVIDESALNDYLDLRYPEYQSNVKLKPGGLILSGTARILNQLIQVQLEGDLKVISQKKLRFYPTRLRIANNNISGSLLRIVSEQVPLEFSIMEDWPLKMKAFQLEAQKIKVSMEEFNAGSR